MQTLLDDNLMPLGGIIESRAHAAVPPFHGSSTLRIRRRLLHTVRVIDYHVVPTLTGASRHRHDNPIAGPVILKALLLVLIVPQLEPGTPALLIPVRLDQASAFQAVANRQRLAIAA